VRNVHRVWHEYDHCQVAKGVTITPRMGRVALFYNLLPHSMAADYHTWHGSCDVARGEKWAANYWFNFGLLYKLKVGAEQSIRLVAP